MAEDPFKLVQVNTMGSVADMATWLQEKARDPEAKVAVAFKLKAKKLAFSTREDAFVIDLKSSVAPIALGMMRGQLVDQHQLRLLFRDIASDLPELAHYLAKELGVAVSGVFQSLEVAAIGDLVSAARCLNQVVTRHTKFLRVEQDAYDIALTLPQYEYSVVPFYWKVALPQAKMFAETATFKPKGEANWWVSYPDMWVRVLAFYTQDPTLIWALYEERDPFAVVGAMFAASPDAGQILLLWAACGCDLQTFTSKFPKSVQFLPEDLNIYNKEIEKHMPVMWSNIGYMKEAYVSSHTAETRYGRKLRSGHTAGDAVAHRIFGSVEDLVGLASVFFWENRPSRDVLISELDGSAAGSTIRIKGVGPSSAGRQSWIDLLMRMAPLDNPLGTVELKPIVTLP